MIRILLVDDNRVLVKSLCQSIPWQKNNIEIVDCAFDGEDAASLLDSSINVLITDVRMPHMDGIELTTLTKRRYPEIQVIFLSAYSEFEYAVEALKLDVCDYITKPVNNLKLLNAVLKAAARGQAKQQMCMLLNESLPYLREHLLQRLLLYGERNLEDKLRHGFPEWNNQTNFTCMVFDLLIRDEADVSCGIWELKMQAEHELKGISTVVLSDGLLVAVLPWPTEPNKECIDGWLYCANHIMQSQKMLGRKVTVGVSGTKQGFNAIKSLYQQALHALGMKFLLGRDGVFVSPKVTQAPQPQSSSAKDALGYAEGLLRFTDEEHLTQRMDALKSCLLDIENQEMFIVAAYGILNSFVTDLMECAEDLSECCADCLETYGRIAISTRSESIDILFAFIRHMHKQHFSQMRMENRKIIQEIYTAIEKVGFDADSGLERIAQEVYLSPSYVSMLFKQETGQSISKQLGQLRLDKAKELLRDPQLRVYEISQSVGYPNQYYFSSWFKKNTGMTPSQYRKPYGG